MNISLAFPFFLLSMAFGSSSSGRVTIAKVDKEAMLGGLKGGYCFLLNFNFNAF